MLRRWFFDLRHSVRVRSTFMDLRSVPGMAGLLKRAPIEVSGFDAFLPSNTDGSLAAEGRTAQADGGGELRCEERLVRRPPQDGQPRLTFAVVHFSPGPRCICCGLTFDMRGGRKWAKPACGRPLDGGVRPTSLTREFRQGLEELAV